MENEEFLSLSIFLDVRKKYLQLQKAYKELESKFKIKAIDAEIDAE